MGEVWVLGGISADFLGIYYCVKIVEKHTKFWNFEKKKKKDFWLWLERQNFVKLVNSVKEENIKILRGTLGVFGFFKIT
jgi:hypothetical protein